MKPWVWSQYCIKQVWWCLPRIPALRRSRPSILSCFTSSRPGWAIWDLMFVFPLLFMVFMLTLRIFQMMYFDQIQTPSPISNTPYCPFISSTTIFSFIKGLPGLICVLQMLLQVGPSVEVYQSTKHQTLKENRLSVSHQISVANRPSAMAVASCPPPQATMGFCLAWTCSGLMHASTRSRGSHMQLYSGIQMTLLPCVHLPLLDLTIFPRPLLQLSLSFGRRRCDIGVPLRVEHSTASFFVVWVF